MGLSTLPRLVTRLNPSMLAVLADGLPLSCWGPCYGSCSRSSALTIRSKASFTTLIVLQAPRNLSSCHQITHSYQTSAPEVPPLGPPLLDIWARLILKSEQQYQGYSYNQSATDPGRNRTPHPTQRNQESSAVVSAFQTGGQRISSTTTAAPNITNRDNFNHTTAV